MNRHIRLIVQTIRENYLLIIFGVIFCIGIWQTGILATSILTLNGAVLFVYLAIKNPMINSTMRYILQMRIHVDDFKQKEKSNWYKKEAEKTIKRIVK